MSYQKNDRIILKIEDFTSDGEGIGRDSGFAFFVRNAVIGDVIEASVMKVKKSYGYARLVRVLEASPDRVTPPCPIAVPCGGCQLQNLSYEKQLAFKENKVRKNLEHIGGFRFTQAIADDEQPALVSGEDDEPSPVSALNGEDDEPSPVSALNGEDERITPFLAADGDQTTPVLEKIIGMENPFRYRNKALFPVGRAKDGSLIAGFYAGRTHSIIPCEDCLIGVEENRPVLQVILRHMEQFQIEPYDEKTGSGLVRHVLIRKAFATGELMVCLILNGRELPRSEVLVEKLTAIRGMTSISLNVNRERTNVIMGKETRLLWGSPCIHEKIGPLTFEISPLSFFQVNPVQTEKLYGKVLEYADLKGTETVWDLYCGAGTISLFLASKARMVKGVEIIPEAVENARRNAILNGITNAVFYEGKAEEVVPANTAGDFGHADVVVVDPPRKGCDLRLLETMAAMQPEKIVYVSCDSATLARDLKILCQKGYRLEKACPTEMFGFSVHVETVCLLGKQNLTHMYI